MSIPMDNAVADGLDHISEANSDLENDFNKADESLSDERSQQDLPPNSNNLLDPSLLTLDKQPSKKAKGESILEQIDENEEDEDSNKSTRQPQDTLTHPSPQPPVSRPSGGSAFNRDYVMARTNSSQASNSRIPSTTQEPETKPSKSPMTTPKRHHKVPGARRSSVMINKILANGIQNIPEPKRKYSCVPLDARSALHSQKSRNSGQSKKERRMDFKLAERRPTSKLQALDLNLQDKQTTISRGPMGFGDQQKEKKTAIENYEEMAGALDPADDQAEDDKPGNMMKNLPNLGLTSRPEDLKKAMQELALKTASPKVEPKKLTKREERKKSTFQAAPKKPSYNVPHDAKYLKKLRDTKSAERPRKTMAMMTADPNHFLFKRKPTLQEMEEEETLQEKEKLRYQDVSEGFKVRQKSMASIQIANVLFFNKFAHYQRNKFSTTTCEMIALIDVANELLRGLYTAGIYTAVLRGVVATIHFYLDQQDDDLLALKSIKELLNKVETLNNDFRKQLKDQKELQELEESGQANDEEIDKHEQNRRNNVRNNRMQADEISNCKFLLRNLTYILTKLGHSYTIVEKISHGHRRYKAHLEKQKADLRISKAPAPDQGFDPNMTMNPGGLAAAVRGFNGGGGGGGSLGLTINFNRGGGGMQVPQGPPEYARVRMWNPTLKKFFKSRHQVMMQSMKSTNLSLVAVIHTQKVLGELPIHHRVSVISKYHKECTKLWKHSFDQEREKVITFGCRMCSRKIYVDMVEEHNKACLKRFKPSKTLTKEFLQMQGECKEIQKVVEKIRQDKMLEVTPTKSAFKKGPTGQIQAPFLQPSPMNKFNRSQSIASRIFQANKAGPDLDKAKTNSKSPTSGTVKNSSQFTQAARLANPPSTIPVTPEYLKSPNTVMNKSRDSSEQQFFDFPVANSSSYKTASRGDKSSQTRKDSIMVVDIAALNNQISNKSPKPQPDMIDSFVDISCLDLPVRNRKIQSALMKIKKDRNRVAYRAPISKQLARLNSVNQVRCDKDLTEVKSSLKSMMADIGQFHELAKAAQAGDIDDVIQQSLQFHSKHVKQFILKQSLKKKSFEGFRLQGKTKARKQTCKIYKKEQQNPQLYSRATKSNGILSLRLFPESQARSQSPKLRLPKDCVRYSSSSPEKPSRSPKILKEMSAFKQLSRNNPLDMQSDMGMSSNTYTRHRGMDAYRKKHSKYMRAEMDVLDVLGKLGAKFFDMNNHRNNYNVQSQIVAQVRDILRDMRSKDYFNYFEAKFKDLYNKVIRILGRKGNDSKANDMNNRVYKKTIHLSELESFNQEEKANLVQFDEYQKFINTDLQDMQKRVAELLESIDHSEAAKSGIDCTPKIHGRGVADNLGSMTKSSSSRATVSKFIGTSGPKSPSLVGRSLEGIQRKDSFYSHKQPGLREEEEFSTPAQILKQKARNQIQQGIKDLPYLKDSGANDFVLVNKQPSQLSQEKDSESDSSIAAASAMGSVNGWGSPMSSGQNADFEEVSQMNKKKQPKDENKYKWQDIQDDLEDFDSDDAKREFTEISCEGSKLTNLQLPAEVSKGQIQSFVSNNFKDEEGKSSVGNDIKTWNEEKVDRLDNLIKSSATKDGRVQKINTWKEDELEDIDVESDKGIFEDIEEVTPLSAIKENLQHVRTMRMEDMNDLRAFRAIDLSDRKNPFKSEEAEEDGLRKPAL